MIKDAEYYKQRIKDLPYDLVNEIREMYKEAESHRFICISIKELCEKLRLEYEESAFAENCQKNYLSINSYLEALGLKLIPCSVPADLSFNDKIYISPKPNLSNDPDCSYVKDLAASKRQPSAKDLSHITRMNIKLSNYNVMLRVFEGLFVVSSSKLDPHQRVTINSIISEMELPKEGQAYLRACYTYACEFRNRHCNYKNKDYCFKPLNDEQQQRVSRYLAMIAAASNYREPFNQEYPFLEDLEKEYKKLGVKVQKQTASLDDKNDTSSKSSRYTSINALERLFIELKIVAYNYLSNQNQSKTDDFTKFLCRNSLIRNNPLVMHFYGRISNILPSGLSNLLPKENELVLENFSSTLSETRAVPLLYITENKQLSLLYPNICYKNSQDLLSSSFFEEYKAYLLNTTVIKDTGSNNIKTVTSTKTNNTVLFFNFFIRLILKDAFIEKDEKLRATAALDADSEYQSTLRSELLFLNALSFLLYELPAKLKKGQVKLSANILIALFVYPELCDLALYTIFLSKQNNSIEEYYEQCRVIFELYVFKELVKTDSFKYKTFNDLKCQRAYLPEFIAVLVRKEIEKHGIGSFIRAPLDNLSDLLEKNKENSLCREDIFDASLKKINSGVYRDLQILTVHPVFANLFAPLLNKDALSKATGFDISLKSEFTDDLYSALCENSENIKYLSSLMPDSNITLANLITDNLTRLDAQLIKRSLKDQTFTKYNQLCDFLKIEYSYLATECIENALPKLGLMIVPIAQSLPKEARSKLSYHRIISTGLAEDSLSKEFMHKLCAAQMAFLIFSFIVPVSSADVRLSRYMNLSPEQNVFTLKFLSTLKNLMKGAKPFDKNYYRKLSAEQRNNSNYKLCIRYLKQLAIDEIASNPLKNYLEEKFNELFLNLNIRDHSAVHGHDRVQQKNVSERAENTDTGKENIRPLSSSIKTSEHSFFKAASFDVRALNTDIIASKLNESAQIQDVITKIRIDEGTLEPAQSDLSENTLTEDTASEIESGSTQNSTSYTLPSKSSEQLLLSLKAQSSDVIDINEFKGMCMSLKYMSMDVAVEEINDWSYETFDEPVLDVAYDENVIYITTDLIDKIFEK